MTETVQVEIERKYDIDGQASLPRLNGVGGVAQVRYRPPMALEAVYFDTVDRDLSANDVTLRRRTGGTDAGWHVKIGRGDRRIEMQSPLGSGEAAESSVPRRILDLVRVHVRGKSLTQIARLNTLRSVVDLMDGQGNPLAEVSDDQVAAMSVGFRAESRVQHWREWEVEVLDAGAVGLLDAVGQVLESAGARVSAAGSKVEKVVGKTADPLDPRAPLAAYPDTAGHGSPTGHDGGRAPGVQAVLTATVRAQVKTLKGWDPLVRRNVEDSVHQFRVSCRTLRSILQTYAPLLDAEATKAVVKDLKKLGQLLSVARDAEVVRDQVAGRIESLPGGPDGPVNRLVPGRTIRRLQRSQARTYDVAHARQLKRMRSEWYFEVLDRLDAFALEVPLSAGLPAEAETGAEAAAESGAVEAMVPLAAEQVDAVLALAAAVSSEQDHEARIELMHEVRKEAKRLRYAVKAVQEATGLDLGTELVARMKTAKRLQESLGEHRDSVMFQEHVLATSKTAAAKGEDTFGYGVLFAAEFATQARTEAEAEALVAKLAGWPS